MFLGLIFCDFSNFIFMQFFGFFSIIFGIVVITNPDILAYLIGTLFLIIGINVLIATTLFRRGSSGEGKSWKVG